MRQRSVLVLGFAACLLLCACRAVRSAPAPSEELRGAPAVPRTDAYLTNLLHRDSAFFDTFLKQQDAYRIQIIYTQIDRKADNTPVFRNYYFNVNPRQYFYPASTVKLPTAALALQRLRELDIAGLDRQATMITDTAFAGQSAVYNDPTAPDGRPTIEQYVRKIFLVSDNDAFNRLYEFLGQQYINQRLQIMGYDSLQVVHRLNISLSEAENRNTNPVSFYDTACRLLYRKPPRRSDMVYQQRSDLLGRGYMRGDRVIHEPFDFSKKNRVTLVDLHSILRSLLFPESVPLKQRFGLRDDDYKLIYKYMSMNPGESSFPSYDTTYTDGYSKFFIYGGRGAMKPGIRIFNKEGDAYGFLNDIAYIADFEHGVEFMLSATIYCDRDGVFNDDKYDYETAGYPFLKRLGETIYAYELTRPRKHRPDLSRFKIDYRR